MTAPLIGIAVFGAILVWLIRGLARDLKPIVYEPPQPRVENIELTFNIHGTEAPVNILLVMERDPFTSRDIKPEVSHLAQGVVRRLPIQSTFDELEAALMRVTGDGFKIRRAIVSGKPEYQPPEPTPEPPPPPAPEPTDAERYRRDVLNAKDVSDTAKQLENELAAYFDDTEVGKALRDRVQDAASIIRDPVHHRPRRHGYGDDFPIFPIAP